SCVFHRWCFALPPRRSPNWTPHSRKPHAVSAAIGGTPSGALCFLSHIAALLPALCWHSSTELENLSPPSFSTRPNTVHCRSPSTTSCTTPTTGPQPPSALSRLSSC